MLQFGDLTPTEDPGIRIVSKTEDTVEYLSVDGDRWIIRGQCIACGECEVGVANGESYQIWTGVPIGQPGACLDSRFGTRLDIPIRPSISKTPNCTLRGEYVINNTGQPE